MPGLKVAVHARLMRVRERLLDAPAHLGLARVQVKRGSFDAIYAAAADPWAIGDASDERYDLYRDFLVRHSQSHGVALDIGASTGAPLARLDGHFGRLVGVEVAADAVEHARRRFPSIDFREGSVDELDRVLGRHSRFDAILYADVISYLDEAGKRRSLKWIADHLSADGAAVVAAYCPGGRYLKPDELHRLAGAYMTMRDSRVLGTGHSIYVCRPRFASSLPPDLPSTEAYRRRAAIAGARARIARAARAVRSAPGRG